ncbi:MAG: fibronectin type III domain-containing protein [Gemmatimonadetes bacterium]|nr:fibronectin type III domain-containing protein [Gemmatimonadota bacterium]
MALSGLSILPFVLPAQAQTPGAPRSFAVAAGDTQATLSWAAPASDGGAQITKCQYRQAAGVTVPSGTAWIDIADGPDTGTDAGDETSYTVSSLTNATQFALEIRAYDSAGGGTAADPRTATPTSGVYAAPSFGTWRNICTGTVTDAGGSAPFMDFTRKRQWAGLRRSSSASARGSAPSTASWCTS